MASPALPLCFPSSWEEMALEKVNAPFVCQPGFSPFPLPLWCWALMICLLCSNCEPPTHCPHPALPTGNLYEGGLSGALVRTDFPLYKAFYHPVASSYKAKIQSHYFIIIYVCGSVASGGEWGGVVIPMIPWVVSLLMPVLRNSGPSGRAVFASNQNQMGLDCFTVPGLRM